MSRRRAAGAAVLTVGLMAFGAGPALADGLTVGSVSSLQAGARAGTLHGRALNRTRHAARARITVRTQRFGTRARIVGRAAVTFSQDAGSNDPLRTGTYAKTLTFTLSTTQP